MKINDISKDQEKVNEFKWIIWSQSRGVFGPTQKSTLDARRGVSDFVFQ